MSLRTFHSLRFAPVLRAVALLAAILALAPSVAADWLVTQDGARIAILAKTKEPHPKPPGTIFTAAEDIEKAGGEALPIVCDIRDEAQIEAAVAQTVEKWGGIDILINNASAISLTGTLDTAMKRYDCSRPARIRIRCF